MKALALLFMTIFFSTYSYAQTFGIRGGLNLATLGGDAEDVGFGADYHVGLFLSNTFTKNLWYQLDATYSRQGAGGDTRVIHNYHIDNDYINLTTLAGLKVSDRLKMLLGPQVGVLLKGSTEWEGFFDNTTTEDLSLLNFSIAADMQYDLMRNIATFIRYAHGISSNVAQDNPNQGTFPDRVIQLGLKVNLLPTKKA